jgi:hypothetical protein
LVGVIGRRSDKRDIAELVGSEPLLSIGVLQSLVPVLRAELEQPALGPVGHEAEKVPEIGPWFELVLETITRKRGIAIKASAGVPGGCGAGFLPDRLDLA